MLGVCHWVGCFPSESRFPHLPNENDDKTALEECLSGKLNIRTTQCWDYSRGINYVIICFIHHDMVMTEETTACFSEQHIRDGWGDGLGGAEGMLGEVWAAVRTMVDTVGVFRGCWAITELDHGDRSQLTEKIPQLREYLKQR